MSTIREEIINKLKYTEDKHDVKIVFAIESGSRGWGFESPDSDYDCRFVYARDKNSYITLQDKKDFIEYDVDKIFDVNGWDLQKFMKHLIKPNATMLEWLTSNVVYMMDEESTKQLREIGEECFNPVAVGFHYLSIAKNKFDVVLSDECKIKTYFYVLRPLANVRYILEHNKMPYMEYFKTLDEINVSQDVKEEIKKLYELKVTVEEAYKIEPNEVLIEYFKKEIEFFEIELKNIKFNKSVDYDKIDKAFREIIERVWSNE